MKPTSLDFAILGTLQQEPQSGYGVRKIFETTALGNYSSSPGSIYPALKRLEKLQLITKTKTINDKTTFELTEEGTSTLKNWLLSPVTIQDVKRSSEELILRFAFMGNLLSSSQISKFLEELEATILDYLKELDNYHQSEGNNMPITGRLAFEYGIQSYQTILAWCISAKKFFT
jgi:DNA-binding PadR family transcriptional regulator